MKVDIEGLKKSRMSDTPANATIDFDVKERLVYISVHFSFIKFKNSFFFIICIVNMDELKSDLFNIQFLQ